jgi:sugar phosphate isomerase/epimerase
MRRAGTERRWFWDGVLKAVDACGIRAIELAFGPGDGHGAVQAYGSEAAFVDALQSHGLELSGSWWGILENAPDVTSAAAQEAIVRDTAAYARLVRRCGADILVTGMPMRQTSASDKPIFVDLAYAQSIAGLLIRMGEAARQEGARIALHTEADSVFCLRRDIDLFLLLTDPEYVWFCPDAGHITLMGGDPLAVLDSHRERVVVTHWKDAAGAVPSQALDRAARSDLYARTFRRVGAGAVDWFGWARRLRDMRFSGWSILEIDEVPDPIGEVSAAREFVETALAPILG